MTKKRDLNAFFLEIDRKIYNRLNIANKFFYGISSKLKDTDGKVRNIADMQYAINDGDSSFFDDRYNIVWFHRIDNISFRGIGNSYGRSSLKRTGIANGVTVFWAKRESMNLQGERIDLFQTELSTMLMQTISDISEYSIQRIDFDMQAIEKQEFNVEQLHKESILLKFDFELTFNPEICYGACEEWDCCPV